MWSCESWTCIQTIHFKSDPSGLISGLYLNINIDYTGKYLVVSDINNRVIYVLELNRNDKEQTVHVTMLSEFLLPAPFLSLHILEASSRLMPFSYNTSTEDLYDEREDYDEEQEKTAVCLKMLVIQPKKFQECNIVFQPENLSFNTLNGIEEEPIVEEKIPKLDDLQESVSLLIQQKSSSSNLTLMTPDDFTSPTQNTRPSSVKIETSTSLVDKSINEIDIDDSIVDNLIDFQRPQKDNFASGGSSPSREVQEILSLNNSSYSTQDFFDNLPKPQESEEEPQKDYSNQTNLKFKDTLANDVVWPTIPVVPENDLIKDESLRKELRLSSADEKSQIQLLCFRINALENIVREKITQDKFDKDDYMKELDIAMSKQQLQIAKMLESLVTMQKNNERDLQEHILSTVTQVLSKSLSEKLQTIMTHEVKHVILPSIHNQIDSYRHNMESQYVQKLTNIDNTLRDNIAKAFNNKVCIYFFIYLFF